MPASSKDTSKFVKDKSTVQRWRKRKPMCSWCFFDQYKNARMFLLLMILVRFPFPSHMMSEHKEETYWSLDIQFRSMLSKAKSGNQKTRWRLLRKNASNLQSLLHTYSTRISSLGSDRESISRTCCFVFLRQRWSLLPPWSSTIPSGIRVHTHSAFALGYEAGINKSTVDGNLVPPGGLITFVQKGIQYLELEATASNDDTDMDEDFQFLQPIDLITKDVYELHKIIKEKNEKLRKEKHRGKYI